MTDDLPTVLIVDDEAGLVELYASWLSDRYEMLATTDGEEALSLLSAGIDVALLDRRMPGLSGDEVLEAIQELEEAPHVAMVTAVTPDFDVIEMGFDDYLVKPVTREELVSTIETLVARSVYDARMQEYFSLVSKRVLLLEEMDDAERDHSEEFEDLKRRIVELRSDLDGMIADLTTDDLEGFFREAVVPRSDEGMDAQVDAADLGER